MNPIDFSDYIAERTHEFSGREWAFREIEAWIANPQSPRFFLLIGEPGSGKSAIASRLHQFSGGVVMPPHPLAGIQQGFLGASHFCSARDRRWINPHTFAESLALQLADRYPDTYAPALAQKAGDREIRIEVLQQVSEVNGGQVVGVVIEHLDVRGAAPEDAFLRVVREPLEALYREKPDTRIVILVDGLDEALAYGGEVGIVELLSQAEELPEGVRFVLTSRPDERIENAFLDVERLFLSAEERGEQNRSDLAEYVSHRLRGDDRLATRVSALDAGQEAGLAESIALHAGGNFQYVRFLLDAVAAGQRSFDEIRELPDMASGLDALDYLYFDSLRRVVRIGKRDWTDNYAPLMAVLSVAQEPLSQQSLRELTGQSETDFWRHLGDLWQFVEAARGNGAGPGYRLYHQSFADFLRRSSLRVEGKELRNSFYLAAREAHARIADHYWGRYQHRWDQAEDPYALRNLVTHLVGVAEESGPAERHGRTEQLVRLITQDEFQRAHVKKLDDKLALRRDLERAVTVAATDEDPGAIPLVLRAALALVALRQEQRRPESIFQLARGGDLDAAERHLALQGPDPEWRRLVLLTIAWLAASAHPGRARALLARVAQEAAEPVLRLLIARLESELNGTSRPALPPLPSPPPIHEVAERIERLGGGNPSAIEPLNYEVIVEGLAAGRNSASSYLAEDDGPVLVSFAVHDPNGTRQFEEYISIHAENGYEYYRNRSLWALVDPILRHPDSRWVRDQLANLETAALAGGKIEFRYALRLSVLALFARVEVSDAGQAFREAEARVRQGPLGPAAPQSRGGDPWGLRLRGLTALAEVHARAIGDDRIASALLDEALESPFGFAGFRATACLTLAEGVRVVRPGDTGSFHRALDLALDSSHNVQDSIFCARATSRIHGMRKWSPPVSGGVEATIERFLRDPTAAEFAAIHLVGEAYERRVEGPQKLPIPQWGREAYSLEELARVYGRSVTDFLHQNVRQGWSPAEPLPWGTEVAVPDPEFPPLFAARLAAEALVEPLPLERRVALIQSLVPIAASNPTTLDAVLSRLLLAAAPADLVMLERARSSVERYTPVASDEPTPPVMTIITPSGAVYP